MGSNYINEEASIIPSSVCQYDSNIAYEADFSVNGEVDGWNYRDGVHTYGVWNGFLFGTIYTSYGLVGRQNVFQPFDGNDYYTLKISMKYNPVEREGAHKLPSRGKVRWVTLQNTNWNASKEKYFTLYPDNKWHTYILNMGTAQYWQGDINNLRIYPAAEDAQDGDEFFIRIIEVLSVDTYKCNNVSCNRYTQYSHPCPWIGDRGTCESAPHASNSVFNIDNLTELLVNINGYGEERVRLDAVTNGTGFEVANEISKAISAVDVGGYSEVEVEYTDDNTFKIYSGVRYDESTVVVSDNELARTLNFFDSAGTDISTQTTGTDPATGYTPFSSYRVKTFQLYSLFDDNEDSKLTFDPFQYAIEGGRRDWDKSGMGVSVKNIGYVQQSGFGTNQVSREYFSISNAGKTVIDFNHPFNASGRINYIYAGCTLDNMEDYYVTDGDSARQAAELSDAKLMVFRPKRDGRLEVIHEIDIPDRDWSGNRVYAVSQEVVELEINLLVNKGDLLGIYNANVYVGKSLSGNEVDAQYFQVNGKPSGMFDPGELKGEGSAGIIIYAHSDYSQRRLSIDIDLKDRYNISSIEVAGDPETLYLEYNIARCLDINWECELYGAYHYTYHRSGVYGGEWLYNRPNVAYGIDNLNDGVYNVPDGYAMDDYYLTYDFGGASNSFVYIPEAGPGLVPSNPQYFWVNGDEEWLGIWLHAQGILHTSQNVLGFQTDPISIYLHFPFNKDKTISKSIIYFKENYNFRTFALSTYRGPYDNLGDSDDEHYDYIPSYTAVTLDGRRYAEDEPGYDQVDEYLFVNPSEGGAIEQIVGDVTYEWDPVLSQAIEDYGGSGFFAQGQGEVENYEQWSQARKLDWQVLQHEWEPITCKGFRIHTTNHFSTKICEIELFAYAEDVGSAFGGGIEVTHSDYNEVWWPTETEEIDTGQVEIFVGDTPRYLNLTFTPITKVYYNDVKVNIKSEDFYAGQKGCQYDYLLDHSKTGTSNNAVMIPIKNVYDDAFDLYVDIAADSLIEKGMLFYSRLDSDSSIDSPLVGPDARYKKDTNYPLVNQNSNCAINSECWALKNLIDGKKAYYSRDGAETWEEYGTLSEGQDINFSNSGDITRSTVYFPELSRNRYWKIGVTCADQIIKVYEMEVYVNGQQLGEDEVEFYHEVSSDPYTDPLTYDAPHLKNGSLTGSYYLIQEGDFVGIDIGSSDSIEKIIIYHDAFEDYYNTRCGIDRSVQLFVNTALTDFGTDIYDNSYYENNINVRGGVYGDARYTTISGAPGSPDNCIYFPGNNTSYLEVGRNLGLDLYSWYFSIDFYVKFEGLPAPGESAYFAKKEGTVFYLRLYNSGGQYYMQFRSADNTLLCNVSWTPNLNQWYRIGWARGDYSHGHKEFAALFIDGWPYHYRSLSTGNLGWSDENLIIGQNLKGWLTHYKIESAPGSEGSAAYRVGDGLQFRPPGEFGYDCTWLPFELPDLGTFVYPTNVEPDYRMYQWNFYTSDEDQSYRASRPYICLFFANSTDRNAYRNYLDTVLNWGQASTGRPYFDEWTPDYSGFGQTDVSQYYYIPQSPNNDGSPPYAQIVVYTYYPRAGGTYVPYTFNQTGPQDCEPSIAHTYRLQIYNSWNNISYGEYATLDLYRDSEQDLYYKDPRSLFSAKYYDFFAIDLGQRYDIDLIRSYGATNAFAFDRDSFVSYSNSETDNIEDVEFFSYDLSTINFVDGVDTNLWESYEGYLDLGNFVLAVDGSNNEAKLVAAFSFMGDFDIELDFDIRIGPSSNGWYLDFTTQDTNNDGVSCRRGYTPTNGHYYSRILTSSSSEGNVYTTSASDAGSTFRIVRNGHDVTTYFRENASWKVLARDTSLSYLNMEMEISLNNVSNHPTAQVVIEDVRVNYGRPDRKSGGANDARWIRINLANGDGQTRTIRKVGIYPDITRYIGPAGNSYNTEWESLGPAITAYNVGPNIALDATITGSSYVDVMYPQNLVDGLITNEFFDAWASDNESTQWIKIDLGEVKDLFRFKIYHGYSPEDSDYMVNNYEIQLSTDDSSYTTAFTITNNSSFERTHDLATPISARYVRLYISDYDTTERTLRGIETGEFFRFRGAMLRQIEVYEYYGYSILSSEDYPIIAINLKDRFFISGHEVVGLYEEDSSDDWSNNNANYTYSDSVREDPKKISFRPFGSSPLYDQWIVAKQDTATEYNSGPHYLKHLVVKATDRPNPVDQYWWWTSSISELSNTVDHPVTYCTNALVIDYPASSSLDDITMRPGANFGIDSDSAYRDGLALRLYIEDMDKMDLSEGYFYLNAYDGTPSENDVEHRWYWSTLSGSLNNGWTNLYLRYKDADEVVYTLPPTGSEVEPQMTEYNTMETYGLKIKGKGQAFRMMLDGVSIVRNTFFDFSKYHQGLYLTNNDYLVCPMGEIDFRAGTIEFWLRPDYTWFANDVFNRNRVRSLFSFANVANDFFGAAVISSGLAIYYGNINNEMSAFVLDITTTGALDSLFHIGIVFSNNGTAIDSDNSTIKVYINNLLMGTNYVTWDTTDNKLYKFMLGGKAPFPIVEAGATLDVRSVDGVIADLRIYNYCKQDFTSSLENKTDEERISGILQPSELIEISDDNVTFYKVGDPELPLFFEKVPADSEVDIYVRSVIPKGLDRATKRTSRVVASWDVGV